MYNDLNASYLFSNITLLFNKNKHIFHGSDRTYLSTKLSYGQSWMNKMSHIGLQLILSITVYSLLMKFSNSVDPY